MLLMFIAAGLYGLYSLLHTIDEMNLFFRERSREPEPRVTEMPELTSEIPLKRAQ